MPKGWPGDISDGDGLVDVDGNSKGKMGDGSTPWPGHEEFVDIRKPAEAPEKMKDSSPYSKEGKGDWGDL